MTTESNRLVTYGGLALSFLGFGTAIMLYAFTAVGPWAALLIVLMLPGVWVVSREGVIPSVLMEDPARAIVWALTGVVVLHVAFGVGSRDTIIGMSAGFTFGLAIVLLARAFKEDES